MDDETALLECGKQILELQGPFHVETASSVNQAQQKMRDKEFDVIISDYQMPKKSGLEFLKELRENGNNIPFILFTGKGREEVAIEALNLGADQYVNKIGHPETVYGELAHGIRQAAAQRRAEKEIWDREERLRAILASSPDAMFVTDLHGNITDCNLETLKLLEVSNKRDIVGKDCFSFQVKEDQKQLRQAVKELFENGFINNLQCRLLTGSRRRIPVEYSANILKDAYGKPAGAVGLARNITDRKKAEEELRKSEEKYRSIVELSPDGIATANLKGVITSVNRSFLELTGFSEDEIVGKHFTKLGTLRTNDIPRYAKLMAAVLRGKKHVRTEFVYLRKDGTQCLGEAHISLMEEKGKKTGLQAILRDITNRKKTENTLKESEEKFRTLAEQSPNMIFINQGGKIVYANPKCEELMGYNKKEFYSPEFDFLTLISPEYRALMKSNFVSHMKGEDVPTSEYSLITKKGKQIAAILTTKLISYQGHRAILGTVTDITERKKAEEILQRERQLVEYITEKMGVVLAVISPNFHVLWGNQVLKKMHTTLEGQTCYELFSKRKHVCPGCGVKEVFETGKDLVMHHQAVPGPDGQPYWLELYASPIRNKKGKITAVMEMVLDINERKKSEEKMDEMMKKLLITNEKLSVVGKLARHDARNKLSVITNNIYLAKQQLAGNDSALKYLDAFESTVGQIENIFDFARIYEKLGTEELSHVDVKKSAEEAFMLFSCSDDLKIVTECDGLTVLADSLLRQIFYNLIDNSAKYGETATRIRVYHKEGKDGLKLIYEDNGVGIAEDEKEKIFAEGYGKGTGYGLYLIKKTCEAYGWSIKETGTPRKGAQFTMTLPKTNYMLKEP